MSATSIVFQIRFIQTEPWACPKKGVWGMDVPDMEVGFIHFWYASIAPSVFFFKECLTGFWWTGCDDLVSKRGCPGGPDAADHLGPRTRQKAHRRTGTMGRPKYLPSITPSAPGRFFIGGGGAERVSQRKRG